MIEYVVLAFLAAVAGWLVYGWVKAKREADEVVPTAPPVMDNVPVTPPSDVAVVQDPPVKQEDPALVELQPLDYAVAEVKTAEPKKKKAPRRKGAVSTKSKK